jgi:hypothetical protein
LMALKTGTAGHRELEVPVRMGEPQVTAINDSGNVCGVIAINRDNTDANRERPAFWDADGALHIAQDLKEGTRGRAVHVNSSDKVLVWASHGWWGRVCLIWDPLEGRTTEIPGEIIPTFITDDGVVLGFDRRSGRDAAIVSYDQATWTRLPLNDGFSPSICDNSLTIGGHVTIDGYSRIWIMLRGGQVTILPTYEYHRAYARAINNSGVIAGQLTADNEQHVALWFPSAILREALTGHCADHDTLARRPRRPFSVYGAAGGGVQVWGKPAGADQAYERHIDRLHAETGQPLARKRHRTAHVMRPLAVGLGAKVALRWCPVGIRSSCTAVAASGPQRSEDTRAASARSAALI